MLKSYAFLSAYFFNLEHRAKEDKGAVAVEYALIIGLVALALVGALVAFGPKLTSLVGGIDFKKE